MRYKKGFTLSEVLCYLLLLSIISFFVIYFVNIYKNKINNENKFESAQKEMEIVIDSITDKLMKSSLYTNYYYEITDKGWCFYSDVEGDMVIYSRNNNYLWCKDEIVLDNIEDIILEDERYLKLIIKSKYYNLDFIIGGLEEYEKKNRS